MKLVSVMFLVSSFAFAQNPIEHVIVIVKENHSFVNYFGTWPTDKVTSGPISSGAIRPLAHALDKTLANCGHMWGNFHSDWNHGKMNQFDRNCGTTPDVYQAYVQYWESDIPHYWAYAKKFGLARMFFPSIDGGSYAVHLAIVGGGNTENIVNIPNGYLGPTGFCDPTTTALVDAMNPATNKRYRVSPCVEMAVIPDLLDAAGVSWAFYAPMKIAMTPLIWNPLNAVRHVVDGAQYSHVYPFSQFATDAAAGKLPPVVWLTPSSAYSEHPPVSVSQGENWTVAQVNAVASASSGCSNGTPLWSCSVIFVYWDDPGGFYENIASTDPYYFSLGSMRVPLLCIGPYCKNATTSSVLTDQSINRCIENLFGLPSLTVLDAAATDICVDMMDYTQTPLLPAKLALRPLPFSTSNVPIDSDETDGDGDDDELQLPRALGTAGAPHPGPVWLPY